MQSPTKFIKSAVSVAAKALIALLCTTALFPGCNCEPSQPARSREQAESARQAQAEALRAAQAAATKQQEAARAAEEAVARSATGDAQAARSAARRSQGAADEAKRLAGEAEQSAGSAEAIARTAAGTAQGAVSASAAGAREAADKAAASAQNAQQAAKRAADAAEASVPAGSFNPHPASAQGAGRGRSSAGSANGKSAQGVDGIPEPPPLPDIATVPKGSVKSGNRLPVSAITGRWRQIAGDNAPDFLPGGYAASTLIFRGENIAEFIRSYGQEAAVVHTWRMDCKWSTDRSTLTLGADPNIRPSDGSIRSFTFRASEVAVLPAVQPFPVTLAYRGDGQRRMVLGDKIYESESQE